VHVPKDCLIFCYKQIDLEIPLLDNKRGLYESFCSLRKCVFGELVVQYTKGCHYVVCECETRSLIKKQPKLFPNKASEEEDGMDLTKYIYVMIFI
jgi:hypothetical protein